jgi:carboxypeptidase C (cathepsin A)
VAAGSSAASAGDASRPDLSETTSSALIPEPVFFVREFSGEFNGETVAYHTLARETYIREEKVAAAASFFTVAYLKSNVENPSMRPVTFLFNGGPGSSAQWLHLGAFGPKRVEVPSEPHHAGAPPYDVLDNALSILDVSDLVFVDPIGTGYSRALGGKDPKQYWDYWKMLAQ